MHGRRGREPTGGRILEMYKVCKPQLTIALIALALAACSRPAPNTKGAPPSPLQTVDLLDSGPPLTMEAATIKGDWAANGWHTDAGAPPVDGIAYGSYAPKGDAGSGSLTWAGAAPVGVTAIAIPIVTGPVATASSFTVINDDTGVAIASLNAPPPMTSWKLWRVALPANVTAIRVVVRDDGTAWGEWSGVGTPHAVTKGH